MSIGRVTQRMLTDNSLTSLQNGLTRLAKVQEQLSTGRVLNRPSDNPTDTTSAMRIRSSYADQEQYVRNADDGLGWLGQVDSALGTATDLVRKARDLALQGANSGAMGQAARDAIATDVDQIKASLLASANTTYLERPVFGGVTSGRQAFDPATQTYVGVAAPVSRRVADGVTVRVDVDGEAVFGSGAASVFAELDALSTALRTNDSAALSASIDTLNTRMNTITSARTDAGARYQRVEQAAQAAEGAKVSLSASLSTLENTDIAKASVELSLQEVAYQASLAATSRVLQPSLLDFLR